MRFAALFILMLLAIPFVSGAIIQGKVYDLSLNKLNNVVVEVNTIPKQRVISNEGEYFFNVPEGDYSITARAIIGGINYYVNENISIIDGGKYIIDLFLFPEIEYIQDIDEDFNNKRSTFTYIIIFIIVAIILFFSFRLGRDKDAPIIDSDDNLEDIYNLIKKEKRTTQKEIRKKSSLSEAKISLIITQLEKEGKIKKIKKGRTNIIILNK